MEGECLGRFLATGLPDEGVIVGSLRGGGEIDQARLEAELGGHGCIDTGPPPSRGTGDGTGAGVEGDLPAVSHR
ncbi:MAG: hypothetical protein ACKOS8_01595 [Gemmataceae bacterium]